MCPALKFFQNFWWLWNCSMFFFFFFFFTIWNEIIVFGNVVEHGFSHMIYYIFYKGKTVLIEQSINITITYYRTVSRKVVLHKRKSRHDRRKKKQYKYMCARILCHPIRLTIKVNRYSQNTKRLMRFWNSCPLLTSRWWIAKSQEGV